MAHRVSRGHLEEQKGLCRGSACHPSRGRRPPRLGAPFRKRGRKAVEWPDRGPRIQQISYGPLVYGSLPSLKGSEVWALVL